MTAIQRWYFSGDGEQKFTGNDRWSFVHPTSLWCKNADVEELERLMVEYLRTLTEQRRRIGWLQEQLREMDLEQQTSREKYARLEELKNHVQSRYDLLMQRSSDA